MFTILFWVIYGFIVGSVAKVLFSAIYPNNKFNDISALYTILLGAAGSYVGGFINFVIGNSSDVISTSGLIMGVLGATVALIGVYFLQNKGYLDKWVK